MRPVTVSSPRVAAVILAAGFSRRLGRPKQEVTLQGETLVERTLRTAAEAGLQPCLVVTRSGLPTPRSPAGIACRVVLNERPEEGIASSIRAGIGALLPDSGVTGAVVLTCDQVAVMADHLTLLTAVPDRITGSAYAGKAAVPAYFPRSSFSDLMALEGDVGARDLLHGVAAVATEALALDVDTEEDVDRARQYLEDLGGELPNKLLDKVGGDG